MFMVGMISDQRDIFVDETSDLVQIFRFFRFAEHDRMTLETCSARPADTVDIDFGFEWDIMDDDMGELIDIDPSGSDICRDEDTDRAIFETCESFLSGILWFITMDGSTRDFRCCEDFLYFIRSMFGLGEDDSVFDCWIFEEMEEKVFFVFFLHRIEWLTDGIDGGWDRSHADMFRIVEHTICEIHDTGYHGCWEEQCLSLIGQMTDYPLHVRTKSHIEHTIRFIEDEDLDVGKWDNLLIDEIK